MGGLEERFVAEAFASNWITPVGPQVDAFETEFCELTGAGHAVALSSGTAALHLSLLLLGVSSGDTVFVSTLTFVASANPIRYLGADPVFIDSEDVSWNVDPELLEQALADASRRGRLPKAIVVVHLYGQAADMDAIGAICARYGIPIVEDAAEALGASWRGRAPGTIGAAGVFSFNGNKIITTAGGGMLVSADGEFVARAKKLATQARDPAPHYQHSEIGYNYRLSNILAAIGRGQLRVLKDRVAARRATFDAYRRDLEGFPGLGFMPEAPWGVPTRWLTVITIDPKLFGADREAVRLALERANIEARPIWKPLHLQPVFAGAKTWGGALAERLFERGLCLPSGSNLGEADRRRVVEIVCGVAHATGTVPAGHPST